MQGVRDWLHARGFAQYAELFEREAIDLDALPRLTDENLKELGLPLGHRVKLLDAVRGPAAAPAGAARTHRVERRQLTVMFCDLVGSTGLAERLDPEELRELMGAYQACVAQVVARYDGHVAQYLGDGVMAYFGWPAAHEDDVERSVRAAQAIVQAVQAVPSPSRLRVRIGIATGQVVIGETGDGDASVPRMAVGETPNLAARVQAHAGEDQVLLAAATRRLLAGRFDFDDLGERRLRGLAEPVRLWRLRGESREDRLALERSAALVGRDSELALLVERWAQALEGEGQVVLLCGEPGVGKSRIAHALRQRIAAQPHTWIQYQCSPFFSDTALHPVIEQLRRAAGIAPGDAPAEQLAKLERLIESAGGADPEEAALHAALLSVPLDERYPVLELSPERRKQRIIAATVAQLERAARRAPVLLVVEDVHWVDPTTRELIDQLVPRVAASPMLLLITHRPEFDAPWGGHAHVTGHSLNRLSRRQCGRLATQLAGKPLPEALLAHIVDKTDGVPLFVEELTKAVLEAGLLVEGGAGYELRGALESLRVPATLHDSLMARLDRLGAAKEVAQTGAVIGREFDRDLLAAIMPLAAGELDAALEDIVRSGLAYRRALAPKQTYAFKHALVQEAAYDSLLRGRRAELHGRIAEALEARPGTSPEVTARHFSAAALPARAVPYWRKAGQAALERAANREAAGHFRRALELLDAIPASRERGALDLGLLIELGEAQMRCGESFEPMGTFERAAALAVTLGDAEALAHAARGYADASWRPGLHNPAAVRLLQRADQALGERADLLKAQVLASLVLSLGMAGAYEEARRVRREAQALARRLGEPLALAVTLYRALVVNGWHPEVIAELRAATERLPVLIEQALGDGDEGAVLDLLPSCISGLAWLGDVPGAQRMLETHYAPLARKNGQPFYVYYARSSRAAFALFEGRFAESERWARDALELGQGMQGLDAAGMYGVQMFSLRREQGRLDEVAPVLAQFVATVARESTWRPALALVYAELGMLEPARREFEELAREGFAAVPDDITWINCMAMLAEVCAALDDAANAAVLYARLAPYAGCNVVAAPTVAFYGAADRHLGLLAATLGRWDEALGHFAAALAANERQGGAPCAAMTRYQCAAALARRGRAADGPHARSLAESALAAARTLGMRGLGRRAEALREKLG